uniref:Uncharacterized protein n=1 Tax=Fibrocapsa japonica TaxID=94617 RepID=A0A7S2UZF4_9STRA|mmetsp:Transcript_21716/g.31511  ORF Transcript_21716/g.31511 Transcript_21716/m.31511 type:complete len:142 (+) Transcript_21716:48-473(+)
MMRTCIFIAFLLQILCLTNSTDLKAASEIEDEEQTGNALSRLYTYKGLHQNLGKEQEGLFDEMNRKLEALHPHMHSLEEQNKELIKTLVLEGDSEGKLVGKPLLWDDQYVATDNAFIAIGVGSFFFSMLGMMIAYCRREQK